MLVYYSIRLAMELTRFLQEENLNPTFTVKEGTITYQLTSDDSKETMDCLISVENSGYTVHALFPEKIDTTDASLVYRVLEYICRANCHIANGNIEYDFDTGELKAKLHIDCCDIECPVNGIIKNSIYSPRAIILLYIDGLRYVMNNQMSPEDAEKECDLGMVLI